MANNIFWGKVYEKTAWGIGVITNTISWGKVYASLSGVLPSFDLDFNTIASDFTFTRNSFATRVNENGLIETVTDLGADIVQNGDFENGETDWSFGGDWTLVNGTAEILTSTVSYLIQSNIIPLTVKTYKIQYEVVTTNGSNFRVSGGSSAFGTVTLDSATVGVKTVYLTSNGTAPNLQINQNAFRGSIDNISIQEVLEDDVPRIDYTTDKGSFLLEPASTNLITYSEDLTQWSGISSTLTNSSSETNPSNINDVSLITGNSGTTSKFATLPISTTLSKHTYSAFLKYNGHQFIQFASGGSTEYGNFDIQNGIVGSGSAGTTLTIESFNNDWYRCILNTSASVTPTNMAIALVDSATSSRLSITSSVDSVYVWGVQLEALPYATSYIPTNGSIVTRAAESCVDATPTINSLEGVLYFEGSTLVSGGVNRRISLNSGDSSNYVELLWFGANDNLRVALNGTPEGFSTSTVSNIGQNNNNKIAVSYSSNGVSIFINGSNVGNLVGDFSFPQGTLTELDFISGSGITPFYGNTKDLKIYDKALTDEELTELTTI